MTIFPMKLLMNLKFERNCLFMALAGKNVSRKSLYGRSWISLQSCTILMDVVREFFVCAMLLISKFHPHKNGLLPRRPEIDSCALFHIKCCVFWVKMHEFLISDQQTFWWCFIRMSQQPWHFVATSLIWTWVTIT